MLVVGGGYIAVEFASIFNGSAPRPPLLYRRDLFLRGFDRSVREHLRDELGKKGLTCSSTATSPVSTNRPMAAWPRPSSDGRVLEADCVFYATGRRPMLDDLAWKTPE